MLDYLIAVCTGIQDKSCAHNKPD